MPNYEYGLFLDSTPAEASPTWLVVGEGIENLKKSLNEVVQKLQYLSGQGWGSTEVLGGQLTLELSGNRVVGDPAQDYIFDPTVQYAFGDKRKTHFKLTSRDGTQITGGCTLNKIEDTGGKSTDSTAISFGVDFNGKPTVTPGLGTLAVVSIAGATTGQTLLYVNPVLTAGHSYFYKTAASVVLPDYDAVSNATAGYTAWTAGAAITAVTGNKIVLVEVTADGKARSAGIATVTAHA